MKYEEKKLKLINFINNEINIENLFYVLENKFRSYCIIIEKDKIIYASDKFNNVENKYLDTILPTTITKRNIFLKVKYWLFLNLYNKIYIIF